MPDEAAQKMRDHVKAQAQGILDLEAQRGRLPNEMLRALLVHVAETGEVPAEVLSDIPVLEVQKEIDKLSEQLADNHAKLPRRLTIAQRIQQIKEESE